MDQGRGWLRDDPILFRWSCVVATIFDGWKAHKPAVPMKDQIGIGKRTASAVPQHAA